MKNFEYLRPATLKEALAALAQDGSEALAGGTDLLTLMKEQVAAPERLVDLNRTDLEQGIELDGQGVTLGALTTLRQLEQHPDVRGTYTALAQAAASAATPQLRNMGTLGGNLCQQPRCWYYRGGFSCMLQGDDHCSCAAADADTRFHGLLAENGCRAVHPSDPAVALLVLDAQVRVAGPERDSWLPVADLFQAPSRQQPRLMTLARDELVTQVRVPQPEAGMRSRYFKAMDRAVWAFALVSLAVAARRDGQTLRDVRLAAGGVSAAPRRLAAAEAELEGSIPTPERIDAAAEAALELAEPTAHNAYKIPLFRGLLEQACAAMTETST